MTDDLHARAREEAARRCLATAARIDPERVSAWMDWDAITVGTAVKAMLAFASPTPEPVVEALYQYASDLRFPPTGDSITRRLESVEALIAKISGEK